jgi:hypothetical protein
METQPLQWKKQAYEIASWKGKDSARTVERDRQFQDSPEK